MTEAPHLYQVEDGWIELVSGRQFHFGAEPSALAESIQPEDVAYALARLCRYNGHTRRFFSVAEHTLIMEDVCRRKGMTPRQRLTALHHDDAEYIIGDLLRPIKVTMPQFKALEERIDQAVALRFMTEWPMPKWLKEYDARILNDERRRVMNPSPNEWGTDDLEPLGARFMWLTGRFAPLVERRWLERHYRLTAMLELEMIVGGRA